MIINKETLSALFTGFKTAFSIGVTSAPSVYREIAMVVPSNTREEIYGWLGQFPGVREWIGPRQIKNLSAHSFSIVNRLFESTIEVPRTDIEDDRLGVFAPIAQELGRAAADHPDQLVFSLLASGFTTKCYDGQSFFDTDHPVGLNGQSPVVSVSNFQDGAGPAWFLLDTTRAMKPIIYQERIPYKLTQLDDDSDKEVFLNDRFVYGTRGRSNVGFGLWQLAYASKAALTPANYEAARAAMATITGDEGRPLNVKPNILVVPSSLEGAAMRLLNNGTRIELVGDDDTPVAIQNEWAGTAKPIVTAWLG